MSCPEGAPEIEEDVYPEHMQKIHPSGQIASLKNQKNIPKVSKDLPPGIKPGDLPSEEFMKTIEEIEKAKSEPKLQDTKKEAPSKVVEEPKNVPAADFKITLTYKYTGEHQSMHSVDTLEVDVEKKHFVLAFCNVCKKQIQSREVAKL